MPADAKEKTHKADTAQRKRVWSEVANERLSKTGDEGLAIREANAVVSRIPKYGHGKKK